MVGRWLLVIAAVVAFVAVLMTSYQALWLALVFLAARAAIAVGALLRRR
ncbi:MAG TPA: hypothetical protein VFJ93_02125 [Gaiellaceae bacterium]|nr:hypothetical protein [Gaiellaceae bacterium]